MTVQVMRPARDAPARLSQVKGGWTMEGLTEWDARIAYLENLNLDLQEIIETLERRNADLVREISSLKTKSQEPHHLA
jgi:hypothetical protein